MLWESGTPVSFQKFHSLSFGHQDISTFSCHLKYSQESCGCLFLDVIKKVGLTTLYPVTKCPTCTVLLVTNLAEPDWISIDCTVRVLVDIVCTNRVNNKHEKNGTNQHSPQAFCLLTQVLVYNKCFKFLEYRSFDLMESVCEPMKLHTFASLDEFHVLMEAIAVLLPPLISRNKNGSQLVSHVPEKHSGDISHNANVKPAQTDTGLQICTASQTTFVLAQNVLLCATGTYISASFVCDGKKSCPGDDLSDENHTLCSNIHDPDSKPHSTSLRNDQGDLSDKTESSLLENPTDTFTCHKSKEIPVFMVDDLVPDCAQGIKANGSLNVNNETHQDEPLLVSLLRHDKFQPCRDMTLIPCRAGHPKCYNISEVCTYRLNTLHHIQPCRDGGHLGNCKDFQCSAQFKCEMSHCIPWVYVCDGKWDCPDGEDELHTCWQMATVCLNMFRCFGTRNSCVHLGNLCDTRMDCPLGDDESLCDLKGMQCPSQCDCLRWTVMCVNSGSLHFPDFLPVLNVVIENSRIEFFNTFLDSFENGQFFKLLNADIRDICTQNLPADVVQLDIKFNRINDITTGCISNKAKLCVLILTDNSIFTLQSLSFVNLFELKMLNISENPFATLPRELITNSFKLCTLSLKNTRISYIHPKTFEAVGFVLVETISFHICCFVPVGSQCTYPPPWYVSCSDLLPSLSFRVMFGAMGILVLSLNSVSSGIYVSRVKLEKRAFSTLVLFTNFSDSLYSLYLSVIFLSDLYYRGVFLTREMAWRCSVTCFTAYFIVLWFSVLSQITLLIFTFSRFLVVAFPFKDHSLCTNRQSLQKMFACTIIASFVASLFLVLLSAWLMEMVPMSLCLPFLDPTQGSVIIATITWIMSCIQVLDSCLIVTFNTMMVDHIRKASRDIRDSRSSHKSHRTMFIQVFLVTSSNITCWLPTSVLYLAAMNLSQYPTDLIIWATVGVTPINSLLNPTVFIWTGLRKHLVKTKLSKSASQESH